MRKFYTLFVIILLSACASSPAPEPTIQEPVEIGPTPEEQANQIEADLLAENNVSSVLKMYDKLYSITFFPFNAICARCIYCGYEDAFDILIEKFSDVPSGTLECLRASYCDDSPGAPEYAHADYTDRSDECILKRRSVKPSKISYFNYKKYIPNHAGLKSEDDFINMHKMYSALGQFDRNNADMNLVSKYTMRSCITKNELTSSEWEQCAQEEENFLSDMAAGRAKKCSVKYPKQWNAWKKYYTNTGGYQLIQFGALNLCVPDNISKIEYPI